MPKRSGGRGLGKNKSKQSTAINSRLHLASSVAMRVHMADDSWLLWDPSSTPHTPHTGVSSPFCVKVMGRKITQAIMNEPKTRLPNTTQSSGRATIGIMVSKILYRIADKIGTDDATVHNYKDSAPWGDAERTRGSGLVLTERGLMAFAFAAHAVSNECHAAAVADD